MACPFFQPAETWHDSEWLAPPRLPLGEAFRGVCRVRGELYEPGRETLRLYCNRGYARNGCGQFPADATADALRFSLVSDRDGVLIVQYIFERDYSPVDHGRIEFVERSAEWSSPLEDPIAWVQAKAFVESYRKRRVSV